MKIYRKLTGNITKLTAWIAIIALVLLPVSNAFALEAPTAPEAPTVSDTSVTTPQTPSEPESPNAPENTYEAPQAPTFEEAQQNTSEGNVQEERDEENDDVDGNTGAVASSQSASEPVSQTSAQSSGQVGDTEIETGDALASAMLVSSANTNTAGEGSDASAQISSDPGVSIANTQNGSGSENNGSASISSDTTTVQDNSAHVSSGLTQDATTGDNSASNNVGNATIATGDANSTGTLLTTINTNTDGVIISEFNIVDDHVGDVILDFAANCIVGCGSGDVFVANTENGSGSDNTASLDSSTNSETFQNNDAVVENEMVLSADSGSNTADANTGGDTSIDTGDANVAANAVTFANNNIAGNVVVGIVNIFGDLIGDILFPENQLCCDSSASVANTGNGSQSTNDASVDIENTDSTFQTNDATIANNILFDATTGDNSASSNTGGDTQITTGDTSLDANVLNVVNSNISGGDWWLVIVNEAGNWVGKILGAADDALFAGSDGTDFSVDENGVITASNAANAAVNSGNGSGSDNTAVVSSTNNSTTVQNNSADITNNLTLSANTGGNSTSNNTGGNSSIKTGDANIIANLVNFVNNNIAGNGRLFVTVVNVFGSWMGDFVSPGQQQQVQQQNQQVSQVATNSQASSSNQPNVGGAPSSTSTQTAASGSTVNNTLFTVSNTQTEELAQGNIGVGANITSKTSVKGASVHIDGAVEDSMDKKSIRINLVWLLVLVPLLLGSMIGRKFILAKILPRK